MTPSMINIDKSGANTAGNKDYKKKFNVELELEQIKYKNNIIESDHQRVKRLTRPMLGFKTFQTARVTLAGIEMMAMLKKNQADLNSLFVSNYVDEFNEIARH